jgi:MoaA/NifB/PqqE/SkfB family radical SAM enzyme
MLKHETPCLNVAGIAGPGDALANIEQTCETLALIRGEYPDTVFCLSTNGLLLPLYADRLAALQVSHVTVTVNAVDPGIGAQIYQYMDYMGQRYAGEAGAAILMANQWAGISRLQDLGIVCKVNIVMLKGVNDQHVPRVAEKMKSLGCELANIMQMIPVKGSAFEHMPLTSQKEVRDMQRQCESILPQMHHCAQCRADAAGTLSQDLSLAYWGGAAPQGATPQASGAKPLRVAVASKSGVLVDQHFGQASDFYIYVCQGEDLRFEQHRSVKGGAAFGCRGAGNGAGAKGRESRGPEGDHAGNPMMEAIMKAVADCDVVITTRIGDRSKSRLQDEGIRCFDTYDQIENAVRRAMSAQPMSAQPPMSEA